jgi:hypothetical protein
MVSSTGRPTARSDLVEYQRDRVSAGRRPRSSSKARPSGSAAESITNNTRSALVISGGRATHAFELDGVFGVAQAGGVEHVQGQPVDIDALAQHVRAWSGDGVTMAGRNRPGDSAGWTYRSSGGLPAPPSGHRAAGVPGPAAAVTASKWPRNGRQPLDELCVGKEIDFFLRKIDRGFDVSAQIDQRVGESPAPCRRNSPCSERMAARAASREPAS